MADHAGQFDVMFLTSSKHDQLEVLKVARRAQQLTLRRRLAITTSDRFHPTITDVAAHAAPAAPKAIVPSVTRITVVAAADHMRRGRRPRVH